MLVNLDESIGLGSVQLSAGRPRAGYGCVLEMTPDMSDDTP